MAAVATDIVSQVAELSDGAFAAFCEDIAGMFGVDMQCDRRETRTTTVGKLREHFKKLAAVHVSRADGVLSGSFQLLFDQGGLFILSGVVVMLPESRILEDAKRGSLDDANSLEDAAREVGNLLVGSWDRVFREDCPGHQHFVKTSTFIGKPWEKPEQIELQTATEVVEVRYEMTIDSYPSFTCAAVFPMDVLRGLLEPGAAVAAEKPEVSEISDLKSQSSEPAAPTETPAATIPTEASETSDRKSQISEPAAPAEESVAGETPAPAAAPAPSPVVEKDPPAVAAEEVVPAAPDSPEPAAEATLIRPTPRRPAIDTGMLPSELASTESGGARRESGLSFLDSAYIQSRPEAGLTEFLSTPAAEIMEKEVVWVGPEDTVQDVIGKMQQHNVGYVLVGVNGVLEGLVSGSNILGAVSLYLRPMFAKWRRPQDDATLGVKVKWVMSRPVRTVRPDATVAAMIESMRRCGGRCLPVVDAKGVVQGMVTVFDLLLRILESDKSVSWQGRPPQAPPLLL